MTNTEDRQHRSILQSIAHRAMLERGLLPEFSRQALADLDRIREPATRAEEPKTTMIRAIWISLPLPKPYLAGP
jgi:exoribonuclease-2